MGSPHTQQSTPVSNPYRRRPDVLLSLAFVIHGRLVKAFFFLFYKFGNPLMSEADLAFGDYETSSTFRTGISSAKDPK